ncbi:MAG: hypothetical protein ACRD4R_15605 [Candidatus Acidiferrales bacterium]
MTRFALALAAILAASSPLCAQQFRHLPNRQKPPKALAEPIPAWNVHGRVEEIPNLMARPLLVTHGQPFYVPAPKCPIVAKQGRSYNYVDADSRSGERSQSRISGKDLKNFRAADGTVRMLLPHDSKSGLQAAQAACLP